MSLHELDFQVRKSLGAFQGRSSRGRLGASRNLHLIVIPCSTEFCARSFLSSDCYFCLCIPLLLIRHLVCFRCCTALNYTEYAENLPAKSDRMACRVMLRSVLFHGLRCSCRGLTYLPMKTHHVSTFLRCQRTFNCCKMAF